MREIVCVCGSTFFATSKNRTRCYLCSGNPKRVKRYIKKNYYNYYHPKNVAKWIDDKLRFLRKLKYKGGDY